MPLTFHTPQRVYAAWRKDEEARAYSSSGGLAAVISEKWIENGGVVYGAAFIEPRSFQHIRCASLNDVQKLKGSKYVVSNTKGVNKLIETDLNNGIQVLFIGTPCQVAGVKAKFQDRITTIDLVCHGAPKQSFFWESIPTNILQQKFDYIKFRDKSNYKISFFSNNEKIWDRPLSKDLFLKGFFKGLYNRDCCFSCKYSQVQRISDLTLGDFWGVDEKRLGTSFHEGISMILINTELGQQIINQVQCDLKIFEKSLDEAIKGNEPLKGPCSKNIRVRIFNLLYPKFGFKFSAFLSLADIMIKNLIVK